ncbi:hypothetical protein CBR_g563 [Chara braunii]|uniref:Uncharacterized protein n=1 Tax=Chara braunii TaxID=69332 RepID=A0A388KBJ6_CHABU|nr:hypothetical protein CBR_g563 [Chara braunii]|eukprot:GBG67428.1 hypothetical protein CBR_g563 [Chara braunii]
MARSRSSSARRRRRHSASSSSTSHGKKRAKRGRSRSPRERRHRTRSPSPRRRKTESESPRTFVRTPWEQRRNDFPPPGNKAWFTADLSEEIFALRREVEKLKKTIKQLTSKGANNKRLSPGGGTGAIEHTAEKEAGPSEPVKTASPVTAAELKTWIDKALESALPKKTGTKAGKVAITEGRIDTGKQAATEEGNVEKMVSQVCRDVNEIKLMKYDLAVVKGALKKINEPTRILTPHVSSSVNPRLYKGSMMIGGPS